MKPKNITQSQAANERVVTRSLGLNTEKIKTDFPILQEKVNGKRLVYLDSAATSQKPQIVIDALTDYYRLTNANIHRGLHTLAEHATEAYEKTRTHVAAFLGGVDTSEIIFTSGTTHSINTVADAWGREHIAEGDEIVVTEMEHHANFVPWLMLAQRQKAELKTIPITVCGHLDLSHLDSIITEKTKIVAVTHMSNVLGTINPLDDIIARARQCGAKILIDGAQAVPHLPVDLTELDIDFYAFSSHKMLGPTGVGVLWARKDILEEMTPHFFGGEMISEVHFDRVTWAELPWKFEAGTPNIADVVAFDAALGYLERLGMDRIRQHEMELTEYAIKRLSSIKGIEIQGPQEVDQRGGAISFTDSDIHPHDISTFLDVGGIAIRAGHHCAQPLMRVLGKVATARASLYIYNDTADIDILHDTLIEMRRYFGL